MKVQLRHLLLLLLTATLLLGAIACGDEPRAHRPDGNRGSTPTDTVHRSDTTAADTTGKQPADSATATITVSITAPRDYGYMGQTLQLSATVTGSATATWRSTNTVAATVDSHGLVTFNNIVSDASTLIIATAATACDTLMLTNRCWLVAAHEAGNWVTGPNACFHPGDTIACSIVDNENNLIQDNDFNAASCDWTATSRTADVSTLITLIDAPGPDNGWQQRWRISPDAPTGSIISIMARHGDAAASIAAIVTRP